MLALSEVTSGAIIASIIAAIISLLGLIISKEQKTSEFRQVWIDNLRREISAFIAHSLAIASVKTGDVKYSDAKEAWTALRQDFVTLNHSMAAIMLHLNPKEKSSHDLLEVIKQIEKMLSPAEWKITDAKEFQSSFDSTEKKFVSLAQAILKCEWERVKKGELTFRVTKYLAIFVVVVFVSFAMVDSCNNGIQAPVTTNLEPASHPNELQTNPSLNTIPTKQH